jgi:glycosyltransferase involved in cell wall biosynthesis
MRASALVEVLAERYRVFVVDTRLWPWRAVSHENWVRKHAAGYVAIREQVSTEEIGRICREEFEGAKFDAVYAFRLASAPLALRFLSLMGDPRPRCVLDLDDDDVSRTERFIDLRERNGDHGIAATEKAALPRLRMQQKMLLPRFDVNLLAGPGDCSTLAQQFPQTKFMHLPNAVREAPAVNGASEAGRLLFVGSLDYMPNEDGVRYFCQSILPQLRSKAPHFKLRVVGDGASARMAVLGRFKEVELAGLVPDVTPEYAKAAVAVVPLRSGSGTRIKILEAFSYRRPVVSTSMGAEGIGAVHGEHLLLADTPEEFAGACARLLADASLRNRLVENAYELFRQEYSFDKMRCILNSIYPA